MFLRHWTGTVRRKVQKVKGIECKFSNMIKLGKVCSLLCRLQVKIKISMSESKILKGEIWNTEVKIV